MYYLKYTRLLEDSLLDCEHVDLSKLVISSSNINNKDGASFDLIGSFSTHITGTWCEGPLILVSSQPNTLKSTLLNRIRKI